MWSAFFGGAVVAAYLFGCCLLMGGLLVALGGIALIAFLAWVQQCYDWCTMIAYLVSAVVSGVGTVIAILAAIPVVQACAVVPVGVGAGVLAALVAAAAASCIVAPSSGSPATGTEEARRRAPGATGRPRAGRNIQHVVHDPVRGLGDLVTRATAAAGVKPCVRCKSRAERLNRAVPFGRRVGSRPAIHSSQPR